MYCFSCSEFRYDYDSSHCVHQFPCQCSMLCASYTHLIYPALDKADTDLNWHRGNNNVEDSESNWQSPHVTVHPPSASTNVIAPRRDLKAVLARDMICCTLENFELS